MAAIITETFRRNNTKAFIADMGDVLNRYYVGLGKSDSWPDAGGYSEDDTNYNVGEPLGTFSDNSEVLNNLTTLVGITAGAYTQVIPNIAAKTNHRHKAYNPYDPNCFYQSVVAGVQMYPCYVVVSDNVYLCLREASNIETSYSLPTGASQSRAPVENADGSVWIYVYSILPEFPINGSQFVTVPSTPTLNGVETSGTITAASGELVYGFTVVDGGSGYVSAPTVEFVSESGDVTTLLATVSGGTITRVTYPPATSVLAWVKERGYVRVATGNARVYPNIAPAGGIGLIPSNDLPSWYAGIAIEAVETINDDGAYIPYRQVSIIRNPDYEAGVVNPELSLNCLQRIEFGIADAPTTSTPGSIITQAATGARGIADYYDAVNKYLYYHQTFESGFIPFDDSPIVMDSATFNPTGVATSEYVKQSGEVVFVENRKLITRIGGQTEEITIILQF